MKTITEIKQIKLSDNAKKVLITTGTAAYFVGAATVVVKGAAAPVIAKAVVVTGIGIASAMAGKSIYDRYKKRELDKANFMANIIIKEPVKLNA